MTAGDPNAISLTTDQNEVLRELVNIGMGLAGDSLARILKTFVQLSIPRIRLVDAEKLTDALNELLGEQKKEVTAVRQAFFSHWQGEAITVFDHASCVELAELLHYPRELDADATVELFLDVGNVLAGACLNGVATQLGVELNYGAPSIFAEHAFVDELFQGQHLSWSQSLMLEVHFGLENYNFSSHLLIMLTQDSIATLKTDLDKFLERL